MREVDLCLNQSVGCGETVARQGFLTSAGVLGEDAKEVGRARWQFGNGVARDTEPIQHLVRAARRRLLDLLPVSLGYLTPMEYLNKLREVG